jgi:hypothetical protein
MQSPEQPVGDGDGLGDGEGEAPGLGLVPGLGDGDALGDGLAEGDGVGSSPITPSFATIGRYCLNGDWAFPLVAPFSPTPMSARALSTPAMSNRSRIRLAVMALSIAAHRESGHLVLTGWPGGSLILQ